VEIWSKARVPTAEERNIIFKLNNSLQIYRNICRNKGRQGAAQVAKEREFESSINQLFDIAHIQAMKLIKIEEDKLFLIDQRTERKMIMSTIDKELAEQEERTAQRIEKEKERRVKEGQRKQKEDDACASTSGVLLTSNSDDSVSKVSNESSEDDLVDYSCQSEKPKRSKRMKICKEEAVGLNLAAALDRTNVSSRKAAFILYAAAKNYKQDVSNMSLSVSSINRSRSKHRRDVAAQVKASFLSSCVTVPLVLHFDGKLLPAITGGQGRKSE
jgi:hypothetical protein